MKYQILFTEQAKKDIKHLPAPIYARIIKALEIISENPLLGKMLKGELRGLRSYRMGDYRIIYQVESRKIIVIILKIGHRKDVYR